MNLDRDNQHENALRYILRGQHRRDLGDLDGAMNDFDRAIELDPNNDLSYICRGQAKRDLGDINGSSDDYDRAEKLNPSNAELYTDRISLRSRIEQESNSINELGTNSNLLEIIEKISGKKIWEYRDCLVIASNCIEFLPENIGNLNNLTSLNLGVNNIERLPGTIGNLKDLDSLDLCSNDIGVLADSVGNLKNLTSLNLGHNCLKSLPTSIEKLSKLTCLYLGDNYLESLPENIGNLTNLTYLDLGDNCLESLPESIGNLKNLTYLDLGNNFLENLPESIGNLKNLKKLKLGNNFFEKLPNSMGNFSSLSTLYLGNNRLEIWPDSSEKSDGLVLYLSLFSHEISILEKIPQTLDVWFEGTNLARRYWKDLTQWKSEWLLEENNSETRRILIEQLGYEKICEELNAVILDTWWEYTLLKIDGLEKIYDGTNEPVDDEPMLLLKMTCPSTGHIHILRVPPELVSAEAAITWVNHGIHPDEFTVQT